MEEEYDIIYDELKEHNGVLRATINSRIARFRGYSQGSKVKILIRRMTEEEIKQMEEK